MSQHPPLTDRAIRALVSHSTPIDVRDGELRGLIVTAFSTGRKQFTLRYRFAGKQKRLPLGDYPGLSLAKARKRARAEQVKIDSGRDPAGERQAAKAKRTDTVSALATEYLDKHARRFKRSAAEDERIVNVEVLPKWKDRSVRELTRRDVRALVERVVDRGAPVMANRTLALVRKMLNFAVEHDWIDANPAAHVTRPGAETSRERVLTDEELRRVWRVLSHVSATAEKPAPHRKAARGDKDDPICPISERLAALLKIRLLTAQRGGEVAKMRWADLDLEGGWWTIPGSDTKNTEPHRVPLTDEAVALIKAQPKDKDVPGVFVAAGASAASRAKKAPGAVAQILGLDFRGHDLRRTAATRMAEAGIPREHISAVLNHIQGGARATRVYDRYRYDREKRIALEAWARTLMAILEQKDAGNVVPFTAAG